MLSELSESIELFQESGIERIEGYIPFRNKGRIDATCLKTCANVSTFEIMKGEKDLTLEEFNIESDFKMNKEEYLDLINSKVLRHEQASFKKLISLFTIFDKLETKLSYCKMKKLDYMLYLEGKSYTSEIRKLMKVKDSLVY
jgi:hypothetical protein